TVLATNPTGYAGCCAAVRDMDLRALLPGITVPTLVIGGDNDVSLPWTGHGDVIASEIPGARAVKIAAAHLSNLERPSTFTNALLGFCCPIRPPIAWSPDSQCAGRYSATRTSTAPWPTPLASLAIFRT